ncbi:FecR family protein [Flavivirga spongiicola]|uniref:FecR domain-containing protein n=1 Tax=Flavivirga spongiicola TaxID=421621 RepID=A0ABU7XTP1_9FLAO|nr:FecR family protein [Flavivirga sp. MEBiC05379]MDO5978872.1 FecR domain-containing protein [Flavivirga sp. MEBiC05379]
MEKNFLDDTFLARWVSGDLSTEELEAFKKSSDYHKFNKINEVAQKLKTPAYNKQTAFSKLQQQLESEKDNNKIERRIPIWMYSAAAVLLIAFGIFYFLNLQSHYQTGFSEQLAVILPDDSKVQLNANSQIDFNSKGWETNREVKLVGEAFFDVEKGTTFKVLTNLGVVEVLGTEFNIIARQNFFEILCYEGRVKVNSLDVMEETILKEGKAFRIVNGDLEKWTFTDRKSSWLQGESTFRNTPLFQVINTIENQFNVTINASKIDTNQKFTGGFTHKNLRLALKTVFETMNISYTIKDENKIILVNKTLKINI